MPADADAIALAHILAHIGELEARTVDAEFLRGVTPYGMRRPLFPWEIAARTNYAGMARSIERAQQATTSSVDDYRDVVLTALEDAVGSEVSAEAALAALRRFVATQPQAVKDAAARCAADIQATLQDVYGDGGAELVREADDQGVDVTDLDPEAVDGDAYADLAEAPGLTLWTRLTAAAVAVGGVRAAQPGDILDAVSSASIDAAYDAGRQAAIVAHGQGRIETLQTMPEPAAIYASELLDGETCDACAEIDGYEYATLDDALADYPDGRYAFCYGGDRCRGTLVVVWPTEEPDTIGL